jgi:protein TonB
VTARLGDTAVTVRPRVRALKEAELPALLNAAEVSRGLQRYYPPLLRDAGIGGEVLLWVLVDEQGQPVKLQVRQGSGHQALDDAALRVAAIMRFAQTLKDGKPISTWIELPIAFRTQ